MSDSGRERMSEGEAETLFMQRESWCAVEAKKEQAWCRAERKHHRLMFDSSVFNMDGGENEQRCKFQVNAPTHLQRRHFSDKYYSALQ